MRLALTTAALLLACASVPAAAAPAATPAQAVAAFHQALRDGAGAQAVALLKESVQVYEAGHVERSRAEYVQHHLGADMAYAGATRRTVLRQQETVAGGVALVLSETETTGQFQGKPVHELGVETMLLERHGDGWLLAHIHWSSRKPAGAAGTP